MELGGKTVLLTGASGGIGQAIARRLHGAGAQLVLSGRRTDVLEPLAAELGARALAADLAQPGEAERLAGECAAVDVLVANAGLPASGDLMGFTVEQIDRALTVNLRAPMILARLLGEQMATRRSGHLVFISSLAGKSATSRSSVYSATKFGLRGFGQGLREDLLRAGVGVSVVFPGFVREAGMFADSGATLPRLVGTSSPEEVAEAVQSAIERNRGEVDVAPVGIKLATRFAGLAPGVAASLGRRSADRVSHDLAAGQGDKR
jgi:short-subunit dehydrogenase